MATDFYSSNFSILSFFLVNFLEIVKCNTRSKTPVLYSIVSKDANDLIARVYSPFLLRRSIDTILKVNQNQNV